MKKILKAILIVMCVFGIVSCADNIYESISGSSFVESVVDSIKDNISSESSSTDDSIIEDNSTSSNNSTSSESSSNEAPKELTFEDKMLKSVSLDVNYRGLFPSSFPAIQGSTIYKDYAIITKAHHEKFCIYNLKYDIMIGEYEFNYGDDHGATICFGNQFYNENDLFPLLYSSAAYNQQNCIYVYRLHKVNDEYKLTRVQTIKLPSLELTEQHYPNMMIDNEKELMYVWGYKKATNGLDEENVITFSTYKLPRFINRVEIEVVELTMDDMISKFIIPNYQTSQSGFYRNGYIYLTFGTGEDGGLINNYMLIIDVDKGVIVKEYLLNEYGMTREPETMMYYNDMIIYLDYARLRYDIKFNI